ncbi:hypothetical protein EDB19DRAFT_1918646 [Suillus lakei]|nr:hypothetical protein EDB19DRAFT_1918646 [Suillus lakei]
MAVSRGSTSSAEKDHGVICLCLPWINRPCLLKNHAFGPAQVELNDADAIFNKRKLFSQVNGADFHPHDLTGLYNSSVNIYSHEADALVKTLEVTFVPLCQRFESYAEDERKHNIPVTATLLHSGLVTTSLQDQQLAKNLLHTVLYQYSPVNGQNHYIGFAQTETANLHIRFIPSDAAQAILPTLSGCTSTL